MFETVDSDGKGYFTFEEFLKYTNETESVESKVYFDIYDVNHDGVITPDEMRLVE